MTEQTLRIGLTPEHECSYLREESEQLMVLLEARYKSGEGYDSLIQAGFRRSGNDLYRPHCKHCMACRSIRIPVSAFQPSRSQKRLLQLNRDVETRLSTQDKPEYYDLFARYVNERHLDGSMYPATRNQYDGFLLCDWLKPYFLEFRLHDHLVAVAITDPLPHSLSAMYTFFDPVLDKRSLGTFAVLSQIQLARRMNRDWLYLGYQVDRCRKMQYKTRFHPYEILDGNEWKSNVGAEE